MRKEIISKGKYTYPQPDQLISLKQYMLVREEKGGKQVMLRLSNDRSEVCSAFGFMLYQLDARGNVVGEDHFEVTDRQFAAGSTFTPEKVFRVQEKCTEISFRLLYAKFGDYTYRPEASGVNVVYDKARESLAEMPTPRHGGAYKVRSRVVRKAWTFALLALLLLAVAFAAFVAMLRVYVDTNDIFSLSGVQYEFVDPEDKDGDVIVTGYNGLLGNMLIPAEIEGHTVVGIRENAFFGNRLLQQVRIEGVDVPLRAFASCKKLHEVQLVDVVEVGDEAFYDCDMLQSVVAEGMESLGENAFSDCERLETVEISHEEAETALDVGKNAFAQCVMLERVSIAQRIRYPSDPAIFRGDLALSKLHLYNFADNLSTKPGTKETDGRIAILFGKVSATPMLTELSIDHIAYLVPDFCNGLGDLRVVRINESEIDTVPARAFYRCESLEEVELAGHVRSVGESAFFGTAITTFDGSALVEIGNSAFEHCTALTEIDIPLNGLLESIGSRAFAGCTSLSAMNLPAGVITLQSETFALCKSLSAVTFAPNSEIEQLPSGFFKGCTSLRAVTLPDGLSEIGERAFEGCTALLRANLPQGVSTVHAFAFLNCESLNSILLTNALRTIGEGAFAGTGLLSLTVPNSVEQIGLGALRDCTELKELTLPYLGDAASTTTANRRLSYIFGASSQGEEGFVPASLEEVTLTQAITRIENYAFYDSPGLETLNYIGTVTVIGNYAFARCGALESYDLSTVSTLGMYAFCASGLRNVTIPEGWSTVPANAFLACKQLTGINLPTSLISIGKKSFAECTALDTLTLPASLNSIGESAFEDCAALRRVTMPQTMESIGARAFAGCTNLSDVTMPTSLQLLSSYAFSHCRALVSIVMPDTLSTIGDNAFENCARLATVTMPNTMSSIGSYAFAGCTALRTVTMPGSLDTLGSYAFGACASLTAIIVPQGLAVLPTGAFLGCKALADVTLPSSLQTIDSRAFENCTALCEIALPNALQTINESAFRNTALRTLVVPTSVSSIAYGAFASCSALTSVTVPFVGGSYAGGEVFGYIFGTTNDKIPSGIRTVNVTARSGLSIPSGGFANCKGIEEIVLGEGTRYIGSYAFQNCERLFYLSVPSTMQQIYSGAFDGVHHLYEIDDRSSYVNMANYVSCVIERRTSGTVRANTVQSGAFRFARYGGEWYLIDYSQNARALTLPASFTFEGQTVTAYHLPKQLFYNNDVLTKVTTGDAVKSVGTYAFYDCDALTEVSFGASLKMIDSYAFYNCFALSALSISAGLETINSYAFANCTALGEVSLPNGVRTIGSCAFSYCSDLNRVEMGSGLKQIGSYAFQYCGNLQSIVLSADLESVGDDAFLLCNSLYDVYYTGSNISLRAGSTDHGYVARYAVVVHRDLSDELSVEVALSNGMYMRRWHNEWLLLSYSGTAESLNFGTLFYEGSAITSIRIREGAFRDNPRLREIVMGNEVKQIQREAFYHTVLQSVRMSGTGLAEIEDRAFYECTSLYKVTLPQGLKTIGQEAFYGCRLLKQLDMPAALTTIGSRAFYNCAKLLSVVIPEGVTFIGGNAFYGCAQLFEVYDLSTALTINKGSDANGWVGAYAKKVFQSAPSQSNRLLRIQTDGFTFVQADNVWYLYDYESSQRVDLLTIPDVGSDVVILPNAFVGAQCTALLIPDLTGTIRSGAFAQISGLKVIYFEGTQTELSNKLGGNYMTGSSWSDRELSIYYQVYPGCVHGSYQWAVVNGNIVTALCSLTWTQTTAPTCTTEGVMTGSCACNGCTYFETRSVERLPHSVEEGVCTACEKQLIAVDDEAFAALVEEGVITNNGYAIREGVITSTNRGQDGTSVTLTFTADRSFTLSFDWKVSSESSCDYLKVRSNESGLLFSASGDQTGSQEIFVAAGESITITYQKDSSYSFGQDRVTLTNMQLVI